jgi:cellulose biosynthesis protein BcsQ
MKSISVFNNKGGVGKTTLTYHLGHSLSTMGYRVLMIDADPQCNLTIYALNQDTIHNIWSSEDRFIDDGFESSKKDMSIGKFNHFLQSPRSIHFLLKPTEEGTGDLESLPPPVKLSNTLDILPGRLTLHLYEEKIAERWAGTYRGDPLAIRTVTKLRELGQKYGDQYGYDYIIFDTSPSLSSLNKVVISTVDGFFIPASPDLFSLYGIRNIGKALRSWKAEFNIIYKLISDEKRHAFPKNFVTLLGYTIYNAKKYSGVYNQWDLAYAHYNYANQIPTIIRDYLDEDLRSHLNSQLLDFPIGGTSVMHTHNTFPAMAQHYHVPMWEVPDCNLEEEHRNTIRGAREKYLATRDRYFEFCEDLLARIALIEG